MVGDDAEAYVVGVVLAVGAAGDLRGLLDDRVDLVDLVEVALALQQVGDALEAHAGVDVLVGQVAEDVELVLGADVGDLLLHEHEVPDLQEAVLVDDRAAVGAELGAAVDVDLARGAAGAGDAHVPVVVEQAAALDALVGQAGDLLPEAARLVVGVQHRDPDRLGVEAEAAVSDRAGDEGPGVRDRAGLEVVAEREVAVHLEERAVAGGLADLLDVLRAYALLDARGGVPRRGLLAEEVGLERHHAGVDEQQVGVVEQQRRRGHDGVAGVLEVREESAADLRGLHQVWSFWVCSASRRSRSVWSSGAPDSSRAMSR